MTRVSVGPNVLINASVGKVSYCCSHSSTPNFRHAQKLLSTNINKYQVLSDSSICVHSNYVLNCLNQEYMSFRFLYASGDFAKTRRTLGCINNSFIILVWVFKNHVNSFRRGSTCSTAGWSKTSVFSRRTGTISWRQLCSIFNNKYVCCLIYKVIPYHI